MRTKETILSDHGLSEFYHHIILLVAILMFDRTTAHKEWVQEAFPPGGNCSSIVVSHIGESHSLYHMVYAKHMESRNKVKMANDIFNLGIARFIGEVAWLLTSKI
ncbi:hypothetical protein RJ641_028445 [Dillenia turbinata]|uniref:Uncharacterized protein n=1 Tax=Dillenia turbinata TaxID=194707 RepID=A0AAN8ZQJ2_9MAGN